jgi:serine/threonine protein kinase
VLSIGDAVMQQLGKTCSNCGQVNGQNARFCIICGKEFQVVPVVGPTINPSVPILSLQGGELTPGTLLGQRSRYRIEQRLGTGGFGQAYLAYDTQLSKSCVVKRLVISPLLNARDRTLLIQNFEREALLLSALSDPGHPNIPEIYEYLDDSYCLVMKYIDGQNLEQILTKRGRGLEISEALNIIRYVCSALVYMHSRKPEPVLHRDIKPANILQGGDGRIWLIDFGLSKATSIQLNNMPSQGTQMAGTIGYTPPEQLQGSSGPQSDIYALGATLHTLLSGYQPILTEADIPDIIQGKVGQFPSVRQFVPIISSQIEQLILASMAFNIHKRPTAQEFYVEIDSILKPKSSRTAIETITGEKIIDELQLTEWCEQNWKLATDWLYGTLPEQVARGWFKNKLAKDLKEGLLKNSTIDKYKGLDYALSEYFDPQGFGRASSQLVGDAQEVDFGLHSAYGKSTRSLIIKNTGRRYIQAELKKPAWIKMDHLSINLIPGEKVTLNLTADMQYSRFGGKLKDSLKIMQDGNLLLQVSLRANVSRWLTIWRRYTIPIVTSVLALIVVSGILIYSISLTLYKDTYYKKGILALEQGDYNEARIDFFKILDMQSNYLDTPTLIKESYYREAVNSIQAGRWQEAAIAVIALNKLENNYHDIQEVIVEHPELKDELKIQYSKLWRIAQASRVQSIVMDNPVSNIAFDPTGQFLAMGSNKSIQILRLTDEVNIGVIHDLGVTDFAFSPNGQILATVNEEGIINIWQINTALLLRAIPAHTEKVTAIAFSPDGQTILSGGLDRAVKLWRVSDGLLLRSVSEQARVNSVAFSPNGQFFASGEQNNTVNIWRADDGVLVRTIHTQSDIVSTVAFSPDSQSIASGSWDGTIKLWRLSDATLLQTMTGPSSGINSITFSPDGQTLCSGSYDAKVELWRIGDDKPSPSLDLNKVSDHITIVEFSSDGRSLAASSYDKSVRLWRIQ